MKTVLITVLLCITIVPVARAQRKTCHWKDHVDTAGQYGPDSHLSSKEGVLSLYLCKELCTTTYGCVAVDWRVRPHTCVLYKIPPHTQHQYACTHSTLHCTEVPCTFYHRWCVKEATCVKHTCVCPSDAPKGDATIACVPEDKHLCMVYCDPKALTWDGAVAPVNLPCWYRMTDVYVHAPSLRYYYNKCRVNVHALNQLTYRGLFFVHRVLIKVWLGRQRLNGEYSWPLYSSYVLDIDYDFVWKAMKTYDTPYDKIPVQHLLDLTIIRGFDRVGRYAIVTFKQCWVRIKFRPYDPYHQPQPYKPGVIITVPKHAEFPDGKTPFSTVCLTPGLGPNAYEDYAHHFGLASGAELLLHNILLMGVGVQKSHIYHEYRDQCVTVVHVFSKSSCEPHRAFTIQLCAPLLNNRRFIHCFQNHSINPMEVFEACVKWGCQGEEASCNLYTDHLYYCHSTPLMRHVGCDSNKRLAISHLLYNYTLTYGPHY